MKKNLLLFWLLLIANFCFSQTPTTRYVTETGSGGNTGSSWATASKDLQAMINASAAGDEIRVAAGTYKPNRPANNLTVIAATDRNNAFVLKAGVKIYGGYSADGLGTRDIAANITTLSGDIGVANDASDNCYHVVISAGAVGTATLDGLTITAGNADGSGNITVNQSSIPIDWGGGMYNDNSSPTVNNCNFSGNRADDGGGMFNYVSSPAVSNCSFSGNKAENFGGGMVNFSNSSPTISNCSFSGNTATTYYGGGMYNEGSASPTVNNCSFSGNKAVWGGGMRNYNSNPVVSNCSFSGNRADDGGGMNNYQSNPTIKNTIIWGNSSGIGGSYTASYSLIEGNNNTANGNLNGATDPLFIDPRPHSEAPTTAGNYRLKLSSPVINKGNNVGVSTTDLDGKPRIVNGTVDMGAYEFQVCIIAPTILCSGDILVNSSAGETGVYVPYPAATVYGVPVPVVTYSKASTSFFPIGTTTVTVTATNGCGTTSCSFKITVKESVSPSPCSSNALNVVELNAVPTSINCQSQGGKGGINLTARFSGGLGTLSYKYKWVNANSPHTVIAETEDLTNVSAGKYIVEIAVLDSRSPCVSYYNLSAEVKAGGRITAKISSSHDTVKQNSTPYPIIRFEATGGLAPYTYSYSVEDYGKSIKGPGVIEIAHNTEILGAFKYFLEKVKDSLGCEVKINQEASIVVVDKDGNPPPPPVKTPDFAPVLTVLPSIVEGVSKLVAYVNVFEVGGGSTNGSSIKVYIPKDQKIKINWQANATKIGGIPVNNSNWIFDENTTPGFYLFYTNAKMAANSSLKFGYEFTLNPNNSSGVLNVTSFILAPETGEKRLQNNSDTETINYRTKQ